jgi:ELWxxDGT repeat protein
MVKDIWPGSDGAFDNPFGRPFSSDFTNVAGTLFFIAHDGKSGWELWKSDGTSTGTVNVKDIHSGADGSFDISNGNPSPGEFTNVNGTLFFKANNGTQGYELWKSDGTSAGTRMIKDILPGRNQSIPDNFTNVNGMLFFTADYGTKGKELWKSDGTSTGTVMVKDIWLGSDGAFDNPFSSPSAGEFTNVNGTLFFTANNGMNGWELWKSNGTSSGTGMVKDITPGPGGSFHKTHLIHSAGDLTNVNGTLFFTASDGKSGSELWKSDGTSEGTVMVKDIHPGEASSGPEKFINVDGTLFFTASDGTHGQELWKSDGTSEGTVMVKDIQPGAGSSIDITTISITDVNGTLFFTANNGTDGNGLWKSDGTNSGTVLVKDISLYGLTDVNGTLFFSAFDNANGSELWKSDGTGAGTLLVKDIHPGEASSGPEKFINVDGTLFFTASDGTHGQELWKSDGTSEGTVMVKDIVAGSEDSFDPFYSYFTDVNGMLFFTAFDEHTGNALWKSDGTSEGTVMVKDIQPGARGSYPEELTEVNGTLFFKASNGTHGQELWKSDGTSTGTVMVEDINPGQGHSGPNELTNVNGTLFFSASDGITGQELWKYTPTTSPAPRVLRINAGGGKHTTVYDQEYQADAYYQGGIGSTQVSGPVAGTGDDYLYQTGRHGAVFSYNIPVQNGNYDVVLHFAETWWGNIVEGGVGSRKFNVDIEGERKLTEYDIFSQAGGALRGKQETFRVRVSEDTLTILFSKGSADLASIKAIEVLPAGSFYRINAGGEAITTAINQTFLADTYYAHGSVSTKVTTDIAGTQDDALYQTGRHGSAFSYGLPTGNGTFEVTLHFAETWWGNLAPGGVGSRRFNVDIEGQRKLTEYDIFQKARGALRAVKESFRVEVKDGVLNLFFSKGTADLASIKAIEFAPLTPAARVAAAPAADAPVILFPNPVVNTLTLKVAFPAREIKATAIRDVTSRSWLLNVHQPVGQHHLQVDVSSLQPGLYLLEVQSGRGRQMLKFLKQ